MPERKPDPRTEAPAAAQVPQFVAEGAALFNEGKFWHAHEAWELAWHGLRQAGQQDEADFLQALVFVTAAFENLRRGKLSGFRRQLAKALQRLHALAGRGASLGLADEAGFVAALDRVGAQAPGLTSFADLAGAWPRLRTR